MKTFEQVMQNFNEPQNQVRMARKINNSLWEKLGCPLYKSFIEEATDKIIEIASEMVDNPTDFPPHLMTALSLMFETGYEVGREVGQPEVKEPTLRG